MMIKKQHLLLSGLAFLLLIPSLPVHANQTGSQTIAADEPTSLNEGEVAAKDEVVYATLSAAGEMNDIYVVNIFDVIHPGVIKDYGTYSNVENLTDLSPINQSGEEIELVAPEGRFYYQGNMENAVLPWDITLTYDLNGKEVAPDELAGADGHLAIHVTTEANETFDPVFYEHYLVQISIELNGEKARRIRAEDGTIANVGKNEQITFSVMPDEEGDFTVEADITDFEMEGIDIAALPYAMAIDAPEIDDMTGDMELLADAISDVNKGVSELHSGIGELNEGVGALHSGSADYHHGMKELDSSSSDLLSASNQIDDALSTISQSLDGDPDDMNLGDLQELPDILAELAEGLQEAGEGLSLLEENYGLAYASLDDAISAIPEYKLSEEEIQSLYLSGADADVIDKLVETYSAALTTKGTYDAVNEAFAAVEPTLNDVSTALDDMASGLKTMSRELSHSIENMDIAASFNQLEDALSDLSSHYGDFHNGLVDYTGGVSELTSSYNALHDGIGEVKDGTSELESGTAELEEGTNELYETTSDLPDQMQDEIDDMLAEYEIDDFDAISFVADENENIDSVQFVIKTESITKEEEESATEEEEEEPGFWSRLMDLF
ncbi:YhgE/Pip domain-containing protein [Salipaludibacillus agaradhaerens]|uniref:YhgE/Pip domain-containing protein n=2 Tax=Salipaludibacillus agaradhaerens TaxID=76935 RepID=A0A9Q4G028_SALAG|nr:YhgE/Pip domain-containing protein [Salipaludibacillus agaradhaerens]MCR6113073.1 YhgE/Pip domain-containing protein [Salipaludibacillus agaradhaerens]